MASDVRSVMSLEVPLIVVLGERQMRLSEVIGLIPGAIIELPKHSDEELALLVNNKQIGTGEAVKVGENFGLRITYIGDLKSRIAAMGQTAAPQAASDTAASAMADAMLAGQA
ncbi:MAG: FliM/FliN family flagellar motor switch protein [Phycisphaerales bacterium]|nr:FliM/FliN family flagellar motor switch protein [Phycisphaerales bacterium]